MAVGEIPQASVPHASLWAGQGYLPTNGNSMYHNVPTLLSSQYLHMSNRL